MSDPLGDEPIDIERQSSYIILRKQSLPDPTDITAANKSRSATMADSSNNNNDENYEATFYDQADDLGAADLSTDEELTHTGADNIDPIDPTKTFPSSDNYSTNNNNLTANTIDTVDENHTRSTSTILTTITETLNEVDGAVDGKHESFETALSPLSPDLTNLASVLEQLRLAKEALEFERDKSRTLQNRINLLKNRKDKEIQQIRQKSKISLDLTNNMIEKQIENEYKSHQSKYEADIDRVTKEYESQIHEIEIKYKQKLNQSEKLRRQSVHEMDLQLKELTTQHRVEKSQMESQIRTLQQSINAETSKDRLIREWHTKYDELTKEFKAMKDNYESVIENMQKEQQSELEEENNNHINTIGKLKQEIRLLKKTNNELNADNKNLNTLIVQLKEKSRKFVNERNTYRVQLSKKEEIINDLKRKLGSNDNNSDNNNNNNNSKNENANKEKDAPSQAHRRVHSINRRNSSITILDDGNQKTIEIVNLANELDADDMLDEIMEDQDMTGSSHGKKNSLLVPGGSKYLPTSINEEDSGNVSDEENLLLKINNEEKQIDDADLSPAASGSGTIAHYETKISNLEVKIRSVTSDLTRITNEHELLQSKLEATRSKHASEISSMRDEMSEKELTLKQRFEYQIDNLKSEIERLKLKMSNINSSFEKELKEKNGRIAELNDLLTNKTEENANMSEMMRYLEDKIAQLQDYENDIEAYEDEINAIDKENQKLLEEKEELAYQLKGTENKIDNVVKTLHGKETEMAKLEDSYHKQKDTLVELTHVVNTLKEENLLLKNNMSNVGPNNPDFMAEIIHEDREKTPNANVLENGHEHDGNNNGNEENVEYLQETNTNHASGEQNNEYNYSNDEFQMESETHDGYRDNNNENEELIERKIEEKVQMRLSVVLQENERNLTNNLNMLLAKEKEKWVSENERVHNERMENERRLIRDEVEDIYQPRINQLQTELRDLRVEFDKARNDYESEIKEATQSKVTLLLALNDAMDNMRDQLRPKKKP